ncbi:uncharacterized protein BDV17DRAFT_93698 [Aspergillus undulatus]|uniref:uncharacterized protein n=1 Tax=Aspergillus undulatus TaxID=1810928 RepID=UPI003CCDD072
MLRYLSRPVPLKYSTGATITRQFHRLTADFTNYDSQGKLITTKVPIEAGKPHEAYVMVDQETGRAFSIASQLHSSLSVASNLDKCKLVFFHESQYFGLGK